MRDWVLTIALGLFAATPTFAQSDSLRQPDIRRFGEGVVHNVSSPVRWDTKDWTKAAFLVLGGAAISVLDPPVSRMWNEKGNDAFRTVNDIGYHYGKAYSAFAFAGGFYLTGLLTKNDRTKGTGVMLATALLTGGLIEAALKPLAGRARPVVGTGNYDFEPFTSDPNFHSFPSGHVIVASTISFVLARRVNSKPLKFLLYTLAASTAFCRLYADAHWISDVAMAGAIAWHTSRESTLYPGKAGSRCDGTPVVLLRPNTGGLTLTVAFK